MSDENRPQGGPEAVAALRAWLATTEEPLTAASYERWRAGNAEKRSASTLNDEEHDEHQS